MLCANVNTRLLATAICTTCSLRSVRNQSQSHKPLYQYNALITVLSQSVTPIMNQYNNTMQPNELIDLTSQLLYDSATQTQEENILYSDIVLPNTFSVIKHTKQHSRISHTTHWNNTLVKSYYDYNKNNGTSDTVQNSHVDITQLHDNVLTKWANAVIEQANALISLNARYNTLHNILHLSHSRDSAGVIDLSYTGIKFDNVKSQKTASYQPTHHITSNQSSTTNTQLFDTVSIGTIRSCFRLKYGCQRQGVNVCSTSRGILELHSHIDIHTLDGLSEYSHIWIIYIFNDNGNKSFHSTIHPPRLHGDKMGVYATRSPHRINPIGQTLVKLDRIGIEQMITH